MKNRIRLFGIYLPFLLLLIVGAVTLKTIAAIGFYSYEHYYFTNKALPLVANILIVIAIVFFIIYIISTKKELKLIPSFSSPANYIPSAAISAALVFIIIKFVKTFCISFGNALDAATIYQTTNWIYIFKETSWLSLLLSIFASLSIVYFALNTIFIRTVSARRANFGFCAIIFFGLYLAYLYFDGTAPINSPIKIADQLTYAFTAVFFLYEIRLSLGREKWKSYVIFGFITASLAAYSSIPALITYFATKHTISNSVYESILTFCIFLFVALKLILTEKLIEDKESAFITKLKEAAKRREGELNKSEAENEELAPEQSPEEADENQISILDMEAKEEPSENSEAELTEEIEFPMNISSEDYH